MASRALASLTAATGISVAAAVSLGVDVPLSISAAIVFVTVAIVLVESYAGSIGPIGVLAQSIFCFPFIHLLPYLLDTPPAEAPVIWGLLSNPYMFDMNVVKLTAAMGAVGASGMASGLLIVGGLQSGHRSFSVARTSDGNDAPLPLWGTFLVVLASLALAQFSAPAQTIFEAYYTGHGSAAEKANFASAWLSACLLLLFVLSDAFRDQQQHRSRIKFTICILAALYFVVWLQFARGDRETIPFVLAFGFLTWTWGAARLSSSQRSFIWIRVTVVAGVLVTLGSGLALQKLRYSLAPNSDAIQKLPADAIPSKLEMMPSDATRNEDAPRQHAAGRATPPPVAGLLFKEIDRVIPNGTWSAVLLTPLSVAGDLLKGEMPKRWGRTYLDLLLSLPPGFVADRLGYERPLTAQNNPALEMRYGLGGTHAIVVPMINFGIFGVFFILACSAALLAGAESPGHGENSVCRMLLQGTLISVVPHWLWYGEKVMLTALTIYVFLCLAFRAFCRIRTVKSNKMSIVG